MRVANGVGSTLRNADAADVLPGDSRIANPPHSSGHRDAFEVIRNGGARALPVAAPAEPAVTFDTNPDTGARTMRIKGTSERDQIAISREDPKDPKSRYVVEVNGVKTLVPANKVDRITIEGQGGNDSIKIGPGVTPKTDAKLDPIERLVVSGGDGDDTIVNKSDGATLIGGKGDDNIVNDGEDAVIGTEGNEAGDDSIINRGRRVTIAYESGNQYVMQNGSVGNIYLGGGNDRVWLNGNDNVVETAGGKNSVTIGKDAKDNTVRLNAGDPEPTVTDNNPKGGNKVKREPPKLKD